jgi:pimeloyl-ACP methyl ester carboxylesterase
MSQTTSLETRVVGDGADAITYDVRGDLADATPDRPALLIIGSPMGASGFGTLAGHFPDRPVVTYDPRGSGRNPTDTAPITPEQHAEDLHRVIAALDAGPVDVFATSGGAVNALALVAVHPDDVHRLVAHEPPTARWLPDRDEVVAACADIGATYQKSGHGPAMAKFIALVTHDGELSADYPARPAPDPAMFGMSADDDGTRTDPLMRNMPACITYEPDTKALAALGERLIVGVGKTSGQTMAARGARSVAGAVGVGVTEFAGDHGGFLGGEFGQTGEPDAFAADLHAVLD